jgi:hypothetical protein
MSEYGPGAKLRSLCERFDRLLSLDHRAAREQSEQYDVAYHDAVHALKDLRQFADIVAPTWAGAAQKATASSEQRKQSIGNLDEIHAEQGKPVVVVSRASIERDDFVPQVTPLDRIDAQLRYERDTLGRGFIEGPIEMSDLEAIVADARLLQELREIMSRR